MSPDQNDSTRKTWLYIAAALAALLLALGLTMASRERHFLQVTETWTTEKKELTEALHKTETEKSELTQQLDKAQRTTEETVPMVLPDGRIAYVTRKTSETLEKSTSTLKRDYASQLDVLKKSNTDLLTKLKQKTEETVKNAPRWAASLGIPILAYQDVTRWRLGAGMNLGPFTAQITHPLALTLDPGLEISFRF